MADPKRKVEEVSEAVTFLTDKFEKLGISVEDFIALMGGIREESDKTKQSHSDMFAGLETAIKKVRKEEEINAEETAKSWKTKFKEINKGYEEFVKDLRSKGGLAGAVGELLPQKDISGMQGGMQKLKGSILSELPFGGLLGLMMYGSMKEDEFRAQSTQVMRMFQQSGEVAAGTFGAIQVEARELGVMLGMKPPGMFAEFQQSAGQFAQAGVEMEEVLQKINIHGGDAGESILKTSSRLDSLFKLGAGTSAKNMSQLIRDFNVEATESATVMAGIGLAARDSGTSVTAFSSSVMRSAASMRTMRVDIEEVAEAQLKFTKIVGRMPGVSKQFAGAYAERATQQITQGMSGMGVGLSAVLAERISARRPDMENVEGLDAYYAFKEGFGGVGQKDGSGVFAEGISELLKMAKETGGSEGEQRYFLEKMVPGMGIEGSKVLVEMQKQSDISGKSIEEIVKSKEGQAALKDAFKNRAKETGKFQRSLLKIQNGLAKVGAGLLGIVLAGFKTIQGLIERIWGDKDKGKDLLWQAQQQTNASIGYIAEGVKGMGKGFQQGFGAVLGTNVGGRPKEDYIHDMSSGAYKAVFGKDDSEKEKDEARKKFTNKTTTTLGQRLAGKGVSEEDIGKLLKIYSDSESETGFGEKAYATAVDEMLGGGKDTKKLRGLASKTEADVANWVSIQTASGESVRLKILIKQEGNPYSGQTEGR